MQSDDSSLFKFQVDVRIRERGLIRVPLRVNMVEAPSEYFLVYKRGIVLRIYGPLDSSTTLEGITVSLKIHFNPPGTEFEVNLEDVVTVALYYSMWTQWSTEIWPTLR